MQIRARAAGCVAAVLVLAGALAGCGGSAHMPPALVGPGAVAPTRQSFEGLVVVLRGLGYETRTVDLAQGQIQLVARYHRRLGDEHLITVQCFGDGWLRLTPSGASVRMDASALRMPAPLRDEVVGVAEALDGSRGGR